MLLLKTEYFLLPSRNDLSKSIPNISTHENNNAATIISMLNPNTYMEPLGHSLIITYVISVSNWTWITIN